MGNTVLVCGVVFRTYWRYTKLGGGSCECHRAEWLRGEKVDCYRRGRLVHLAFRFASERLDDLLLQANAWSEDHWGKRARKFLIGVQGMVRAVFSRGSQKVLFLDEIPYLISRIGIEPDAGRRCVAQYDSTPKHLHDKVSIEVLDQEAPTRQLIDSLPPYLPQLLEDDLRDVVQRIRDANLLDKLAEGPHSVFRKIDIATRGSKFPWKSATMRLTQNLEDVDTLPSTCDLNLQKAWDHWKNVLQPRGMANVRDRRKKILKKVYHCAHHFEDEGSNAEDGNED